MAVKQLVCALCIVSVYGCALNPYVTTGYERDGEGDNTRCPYTSQTEAVKYACQKRAEIESKRQGLTDSDIGVAAILYPLAALVGYKTLRSTGSANTTALAAGGLALYGLSSNIVQVSRLTAYDKAVKSLSCAIGVHETYLAQVVNLPMLTYYEKTREKALPIVKKYKDYFESPFEAQEDGVRSRMPTSTLDAQLVQKTDEILSDLNTALTTTVLPVTAISSQAQAFQNPGAPPAKSAPLQTLGAYDKTSCFNYPDETLCPITAPAVKAKADYEKYNQAASTAESSAKAGHPSTGAKEARKLADDAKMTLDKAQQLANRESEIIQDYWNASSDMRDMLQSTKPLPAPDFSPCTLGTITLTPTIPAATGSAPDPVFVNPVPFKLKLNEKNGEGDLLIAGGTPPFSVKPDSTPAFTASKPSTTGAVTTIHVKALHTTAEPMIVTVTDSAVPARSISTNVIVEQ